MGYRCHSELMLLQKLHFFGRDYVSLTLSAQKYTQLYEKGIKQNQNKPMETTNNIPCHIILIQALSFANLQQKML